MKKTDKKDKIRVLPLIGRCLKLSFGAERGLMTGCVIISLIDAFLMFATVPTQEKLFNAISDAVPGTDGVVTILASALVIYLAVSVVERVANGFLNYGWNYASNKINGKLQMMLDCKKAKLDAIKFEDTKVLDDINKAQNGMYMVGYLALIVILSVTFYIIYIILMTLYLTSLKPIFILALVFSTVPCVLSQLIRVKIQAKLEDKSAPWRRQYGYYESCITDRVCYKETRLLGGFAFFRDLYMSVLATLQALEKKAYIKNALLDLLMQIMKLAGRIGMLWLLFDALMARDISIGSFAAVYASAEMLQVIISELIEMHFRNIAENLGKLNNFVRLIDSEERGGDDVGDIDGDVVLENVTFCYPISESDDEKKEREKRGDPPKTQTAAVKNVSLAIKNGETLAIVGENGSGKSTISRLITGMYTPSDGKVFRGGKDASELSYRCLFRNTSGVFQRFQRYQLTLRENVCISDTEREENDDYTFGICRTAGVDTDGRSYPQKLDTVLSREFDGVDLSGGQWQRVAIARGIYRENGFIILDEPTAAIDPIEEKRIYENFTEISRGKTAILITHRLGSVRLADRILMMKQGEAVGIGKHEDLMISCPEYAELYNSQADLYK